MVVTRIVGYIRKTQWLKYRIHGKEKEKWDIYIEKKAGDKLSPPIPYKKFIFSSGIQIILSHGDIHNLGSYYQIGLGMS